MCARTRVAVQEFLAVSSAHPNVLTVPTPYNTYTSIDLYICCVHNFTSIYHIHILHTYWTEQVVESLMGGPVRVPNRNRGIYFIFPRCDTRARDTHG